MTHFSSNCITFLSQVRIPPSVAVDLQWSLHVFVRRTFSPRWIFVLFIVIIFGLLLFGTDVDAPFHSSI